MPLAKLKTTEFAAAATPPAAETDGSSTAPSSTLASPARLLQQRLEYRTTAAAMPEVERWPLRRSLALILASSIALWAAIIEATSAVVHAVA